LVLQQVDAADYAEAGITVPRSMHINAEQYAYSGFQSVNHPIKQNFQTKKKSLLQSRLSNLLPMGLCYSRQA